MVFDVDGTLLDSMPFFYRHWPQVGSLPEFQLEVPEEEPMMKIQAEVEQGEARQEPPCQKTLTGGWLVGIMWLADLVQPEKEERGEGKEQFGETDRYSERDKEKAM